MLVGKDKLLAQLRKVVYAFCPCPRTARAGRVQPRKPHFYRLYQRKDHRQCDHRGDLFCLYQPVWNQFALLISVVVGVTNIIPFFGPFIGAVPCIMILLMVNPIQALEFGIL